MRDNPDKINLTRYMVLGVMDFRPETSDNEEYVRKEKVLEILKGAKHLADAYSKIEKL